jgi:hypothetical protein
MLPYLQIDSSGRTLYRAYQQREAVAMLEPAEGA